MDLTPGRALRLGIFAFSLAAIFAVTIAFQILPVRAVPGIGEVATQDIKAPARVSYVSDLQTRLRREEAAESVATVQTYDPAILRTQLDRLGQMQTAVLAVLDPPVPLLRQDRVMRLRAENLPMSGAAVETLADLGAQDWRVIVEQARFALGTAMGERVTADRLDQARLYAESRVDTRLSPAVQFVARDLIGQMVQPTVAVDLAETDRLRQAAVAGVEPVRLTIEAGETIVRDGQVVTPAMAERIRAAGITVSTWTWQELGGLFLVGLMGSGLLALAIYRFDPVIVDHSRRLLLIGAVMAATVVAAKVMLPGRDVWAVLFPFAAAPMLIAALLNARLGLFVGSLLAIWVVMATRGSLQLADLELALLFLLSGTAGVLVAWRAQRLSRYAWAGAGVAGTVGIMLVGFYLASPSPAGLDFLGIRLLAGAVNGLLVAILTVGVFILLGWLFGITTTWQLLELAQPSQPLLKRLLTEAPGTYHHSIIVANLAERAAESVGADPVLARVGAYYHDVGKMLRPGFFVENQLDGQSPHKGMTPEASAAIIRSHVTDGIDLAKQYGLPQKVRAFIPEHHGTRMAMYFYAMATKIDPDVPQEWFRYPGPRPQTRETAIVMLADGTEATVRSNPDHSPENIRAIIDQTVRERVEEGQLDDSGLTLGDLARIKEAFFLALRGVYHPRIEYPEPVKAAGSRLRLRAAPRQLPAPESSPAQATTTPPTP